MLSSVEAVTAVCLCYSLRMRLHLEPGSSSCNLPLRLPFLQVGREAHLASGFAGQPANGLLRMTVEAVWRTHLLFGYQIKSGDPIVTVHKCL